MILGWKRYALILAAGVALAAVVVVAWSVHGNNQFKAGYAKAQTDAALASAVLAEQYRQREQDLQDQANAKYAQAVQDAQTAAAAARGAALRADSLQRTIELQRANAAENARRAGSSVDAASAPWIVLKECTERYTELGKRADAIVEQFRPVVGWAEVIDPTGRELFERKRLGVAPSQ